jgi:asparagine synthase (glutamine-hydrolysing)
MCGITALINKSTQKADYNILKSMADVIHYRGPDDEGAYIHENIGLYHKRLSIIDLKTGQQPMQSGNLVIVFNGEIYNYVELRQELKADGFQFETTSDTEVILKLYERDGLDAIDKLNGMFAFIIHDRRTNKLIIARDHFGIKPLYFYNDSKFLLFGSEIKAIVDHPGVVAEPNYNIINEYLTFQFTLNGETLFQNISKVRPGHYVVVDLNDFSIEQVQYWDPNFKTDMYHTEEYFIDKLRELLEDTIKIQLRSDVSLGAYLSGGMDSSLVTMLSSKFLSSQIQTFTGAFSEGAEFNETKHARIVAEKSGANYNEIYPTEQDFIDNLPKLIYHLDEPVVGPGVFPQFMVSKLASSKVKVVLGGQGGDEIFGGYARYAVAYLEQAIKGAIFESNEEAEHIVNLKSILPNLPYLKQYIPMMKQFCTQGAYDEMDARYFHLIDRSDSSLSYFSNDFRSKYKKEAIFKRFQGVFNHPDTLSYFNKMTHFDMFGSLPGLLQVEDRVSMAASIESRVPLLDRRIVDLVSRMPAGMKFKGGEMKYLLKRAISDMIPHEILNRKDKMGFPVPLHIWFKGKTGEFIKDMLHTRKCRERGILDNAKVDELISSERPFGRALWGIISLELWFNQFIDNQSTKNNYVANNGRIFQQLES